jgi:hypothetical protein
MTLEEARFEIKRLSVKQKQLEGEVLAILNTGCLPLEEAKRRMDETEASGAETEIKNGVKYLVEKRTFDGKEYKTHVLPLWYPRYAGMDDVLENIEMEKAVIRDLKERQAERQRYNQAWGCKPMDGRYIAAMEKVLEKTEEYLANKSKIEELSEALEQDGVPNHQEDTMAANDERLPPQSALEKLCGQESPVIQRWKDGAYRITARQSLEEFVTRYGKLSDDLDFKLIQTYIRKSDGKLYSPGSIENAICSRRV